MNSFIWYPLIFLYCLAIAGSFVYARTGIIYALEQGRIQAEAVRLYAREESMDRDHDIEELRKIITDLNAKLIEIEQRQFH